MLDVIEQELVAQNALEQGAWIRARLEALMERHALIGEVRWLGLLIGVELVRDRNTREPAIAEAGLVLNAMRERGVLVGHDRAGEQRAEDPPAARDHAR